MDCKQFEEWISFWLDGELGKQEKEFFEKHLKECPKCYRVLEEYKAMFSLMEDMEDMELPEGFHHRLYQGLKMEIQMGEKPGIDLNKPVKWTKWLGAIAAIFVLLFSLKALNGVNLKKDMLTGESPQQSSEIEERTKGQMGMQSVEDSDKASALDTALKFDGNAKEAKEERAEQDKRDDSTEEAVKNEGMPLQEQEGITAKGVQSIQSDLVRVKVQDVCVTPSTLKMMAVRSGADVIKSTEDSVTLEFTELDQRKTIYEELIRIGEVEEVGEKTDSSQVTIIIVRENQQE